jgi:hypothetical protein
MKQVVKNQKFSIFDDVFNEHNLSYIQLFLQHAPFDYPYSSDGIHGISKPFRHDIIYNNIIDGIFTYAKQIAEFDFCSGWKDCILTHSIYPRGSKGSWTTHVNNKAIMYFYVHEKWKANWGGELLIGQTPPNPDSEEKAFLDNRWHDEHLNQFGTGLYITPKPNRCVVVPGSEWSKINQVSDDAGDTSLLFFQVLFY